MAEQDPPAFRTYAPPSGTPLVLPVASRLESWDAIDQPAQRALRGYLDRLETLVPTVGGDGQVLELVVGLPAGTDLLAGGRDLDNYLYPVLRRLGPRRFVSVWGAKRRGESTLAIGIAEPIDGSDLDGWLSASALVRGSSQSPTWKAEIARQVGARASALPDGPVELQLCFQTGPGRNWAALWKPAIDALGCVLGESSRRPFHPRDDRVVRLGLHHQVSPGLGHAVRVGIWWRLALGTTSRPRPGEPRVGA